MDSQRLPLMALRLQKEDFLQGCDDHNLLALALPGRDCWHSAALEEALASQPDLRNTCKVPWLKQEHVCSQVLLIIGTHDPKESRMIEGYMLFSLRPKAFS